MILMKNKLYNYDHLYNKCRKLASHSVTGKAGGWQRGKDEKMKPVWVHSKSIPHSKSPSLCVYAGGEFAVSRMTESSERDKKN